MNAEESAQYAGDAIEAYMAEGLLWAVRPIAVAAAAQAMAHRTMEMLLREQPEDLPTFVVADHGIDPPRVVNDPVTALAAAALDRVRLADEPEDLRNEFAGIRQMAKDLLLSEARTFEPGYDVDGGLQLD